MVDFLHVDANELLVDAFKLGRKVYEDGFRPKHVISIWRGGTPIGLAVDAYFRFQGVYTHHTSMATTSYVGIGEQADVVVKGLEHVVRSVCREDGLLIIDHQGVVRFGNPAAEKMIGHPAGSLVGQNVFEYVLPRYRGVVVEQVRRRRMGLSSTYEVGILSGRGEERLLLISAAPLPNREGQMDQSVLVVRDITEQKKQEDELRRARDAAMHAAQLQSEFLANISHELRTPMNAIIGLADLLREAPVPDRARECVNDIHRAAHDLLALIEDLLDFSRIESGRMRLREVPFQPHEVLAEVVRFFQPMAEKKGIRLDSRIEGYLEGGLCGDPERLRQILVNLVGNAVKFTDRGHVDVNVHLYPREEDDTWNLSIEVADTGPGIPPEVGEEIFQPFRQGDGSLTRSRGGTGLGLPITKRLVEMHGGRIDFESTPGVGTVFRVEIPYRPARRETERRAGETSRARILVVDDNPVNRKVAGRLLERQGYRVLYAENGREALEVLSREEVELVLMDIQMPVMDGLEATRRIRAGEAGERARGVPVVALTAHSGEQERKRCLEVGMEAFLTKPVDPERLHETVESLAFVTA